MNLYANQLIIAALLIIMQCSAVLVTAYIVYEGKRSYLRNNLLDFCLSADDKLDI